MAAHSTKNSSTDSSTTLARQTHIITSRVATRFFVLVSAFVFSSTPSFTHFFAVYVQVFGHSLVFDGV
jgi:hypothetical protein